MTGEAAYDLTVRDHMMLDLEQRWFKYAGAKETVVRGLFGMSSTRYYQALNHLIDRPEALAAYPMGRSPGRRSARR
jgi:hypothetical protein